MWVIWTLAGFYAFGLLVTFAHLVRTGRPGLQARARQGAVAIAWPAYWGLVHGASGTARYAYDLARFALRWPFRAARFALRLPFRAARFALRQGRRATALVLRRLGLAAGGIFGALRRSVPVRYGLHYAACRRAGLSRRRTVSFAWILLQTR